jgi:hypothetical protein
MIAHSLSQDKQNSLTLLLKSSYHVSWYSEKFTDTMEIQISSHLCDSPVSVRIHIPTQHSFNLNFISILDTKH